MEATTTYAEDRFERIDPEFLHELSRPNYAKGLGLLTFDWLVMILAAALCMQYLNPLMYLLAWMIIGGRMMGLWTLLHDGHHHMLLPDRKLNRWLTQLFIAWPLFYSLKEYDKSHGDHHRFLGTEKDPNVQLLRYDEFRFPMSREKFFRIFLLDLLGVNFIRYFILKRIVWPVRRISRNETDLSTELNGQFAGMSIPKFAYWLVILVGFYFSGLMMEFFLFWFIPNITWFNTMFRLTTVSDHCFSEEKPANRTRSVLVNWFEKAVIVPHGLNFHLEHHTYGGVPCYNLHKLHDHLMTKSWFRENAAIVKGYRSV